MADDGPILSAWRAWFAAKALKPCYRPLLALVPALWRSEGLLEPGPELPWRPLTTALLGLTFIAGQVYEFTEFVDHGLTWTTSPFGSAFYLLTGIHGAHVAVGVILLLSAVLMSRAISVASIAARISLSRSPGRVAAIPAW
jgi:hypothetical protein